MDKETAINSIEPRTICPKCRTKLITMPEPKQTLLIKKLQTLFDIKFIVPLLECPKCEWNWHFGKPVTTEELKKHFDRILNRTI